MYEVQEVVNNISENIVWFMCFGAIGMFCNWWLFVETVRLGFREKTYSIALFATFFWGGQTFAIKLQKGVCNLRFSIIMVVHNISMWIGYIYYLHN